MRIRKKLLFLHTAFSLALTGVLIIALRPALNDIVEAAEAGSAKTAHASLGSDEPPELLTKGGVTIRLSESPAEDLPDRVVSSVIERANQPTRQPVIWRTTSRGTTCVFPTGDAASFRLVTAFNAEVRDGVRLIYVLLIASLLTIYALIAAALEAFILPQHVYGPIRRVLAADRAVQDGDKPRELIPESAIPRDELGEIMQSRNDSIRTIRRHENDLAAALERVEVAAADLRRKNHLLENARRNLEGADRLASLGLMSAGIAHELNTPLAVAKGLVEKLTAGEGATLQPSEAALLNRVIGRLERLGDSLLDFARARTPEYREALLAEVVDEAFMLVSLDRGVSDVKLANDIDRDLHAEIDADRMVQVFVNLVRNAVDAIRGPAGEPRRASHSEIRVAAHTEQRDGDRWVIVTVTDNGPGIEPSLIPEMFEPFQSTRLDHKGTGLGLAVAEGIVREHHGTLIARNRSDCRGAVFELVLPLTARPRQLDLPEAPTQPTTEPQEPSP